LGKGINSWTRLFHADSSVRPPSSLTSSTTDKGDPEFPEHLTVSFIWQLITYVATSFMPLLCTTVQFSFVHALSSPLSTLPHTLKMTSRCLLEGSRMKPNNYDFQLMK